MPTFFSYSFGCRVNEAEKIHLDRQLLDSGYEFSKGHPDYYIIHSCAVTQKAEREIRQHVYQTRKTHPSARIIVCGCAATHWINTGVHPDPSVHLVSNRDKSSIPALLTTLTPDNPVGSTGGIYEDKFLNSKRRMVKIQDGCDRFCSYCIVPFLRGTPVSHPIREIVDEIRQVQEDTDEVILTAINSHRFGVDTGEHLVNLIDAVLSQTTVPLVSFGSFHPMSLDDRFFSWYPSAVSGGRISGHFHIPLQSGSDSVLKRMNRGYLASDMMNKLVRLKAINPRVTIGTDIIVGFPGETETEFTQTYRFLSMSPITQIHVFRFSPRPHTAAAAMRSVYPEPDPQTKRERSRRLIALSESKRGV